MRIRPETLVWVNARERSDHEMGDCRRVSHAGPVWTITNRGNISFSTFSDLDLKKPKRQKLTSLAFYKYVFTWKNDY